MVRILPALFYFMNILHRLKRSKFRSSFKLREKELKIVEQKGIEKLSKDCFEILEKRIKTKLKNDGKQTPWKGHPVFVGQHATATCCRKCMEKWHKIPRNKVLNDDELSYFSELVMIWIVSNRKGL